MVTTYDIYLMSFFIFAAASLYSSVGHGGASGYLAVMALAGLVPQEMKPTALSLNILVASIATVRFYRADCFSWSIFWPFAFASIPFAFIGGAFTLPGSLYKQFVGVVLLFAAFQLFRYTRGTKQITPKPAQFLPAVFFGAAIGLLSGLTGVGGGIFLSPLLLFTGWADPRQTAGVSAVFILVNSIAGILGHYSSVKYLPNAIAFWAVAAVAGGIVGSGLGSRRFSSMTLRRVLAVVLAIAGLKFMIR
ncbi:MAG: sulfite exporter TauE/SafE family protein [Nitrospiraceae bacterium]|nr:MAG: sulfite exporter TauE/SafE family protein [Nitrospiraceae bacterium]